jgi:CRP-like cAMP-binding protein
MKKENTTLNIEEIVSEFSSDFRLLEKGEYLFNEGESNDYIYFLEKGSIKVFKKSCVIWIAKPGEFIGLTSNLNNTSCYTFSSRANEDCKVIRIATDTFNKVLLRNNEFSKYIIGILCYRITLTEKKTKRFIEQTSMQRLISELIDNLKEKGNLLYISFTLSDLSELIGVSKRLVSSMLSELEKKEIIKRLKGELQILNLQELQNILKRE